MHIISHKKLAEFYTIEGNSDSEIALERWYEITQRANWRNISELKQDFPSADYVGNDRFVFNIKGNNYRLVAKVLYKTQDRNGTVFVRFVGTHTEYDRIDCKNI
ncbi:MAG: type II toxin-antitoxin system HigB family toxin [Bacteroidales bacterium]|nr:type II toxin-antitoxin system HigB family toxin [Bacteroidales bacterium]